MPLRRHVAAGILAIAVSLAPSSARAQGSGEVRGSVRDSVGAPVQFADVSIEPLGVRARTDSAGSFRFRGLPVRTLQLRVRRIGFLPYEDSVTVLRDRIVVLSLRLSTRVQTLAEVRVMDQNVCDLTSLEGFECRRAAGVGEYRDATELYALNARNWADLVDGIPSLRRVPRRGPMGLDWVPAASQSRCLRRLFNGQPELGSAGGYAADDIWQPEDVVGIEYYDNIRKVPAAYQRFAWPRNQPEGCALIVYWLRGASSEPPENWRRDWRRFGRALAAYGVQGKLQGDADPTSFNAVFTREVQWRGTLEALTPTASGTLVRVRMARLNVLSQDGSAVPMDLVEFECPRENSRCAGFVTEHIGKEILFRTTLVNRSRDNRRVVRIVGTGSERRVELEAYNGSFLRVIE